MQKPIDHTTIEKSLDTIKRGITHLVDTVHEANAQKLSDDPLLSEKTVAKMLSISVSLLQHQRLVGKGLKYVKIGRAVRYATSEVIRFREANTRQSTSE